MSYFENPYQCELDAAILSKQTRLIICNDERDRAAAAGLSFPDTHAMLIPLTGGWRKAYAESFGGFDIVLLPKNNSKGRKFSENVTQSVAPYCSFVKTVYVSEKQGCGVAEWVAEGNGADALLEMLYNQVTQDAEREIQRLSMQSVSAESIVNKEFPELFQPVCNLIAEGMTFIVGASKIGKSWLLLDLCISVAAGDMFLRNFTEQCPVLYLALEDSERRIKDRLKKIGYPPNSIPAGFEVATAANTIDTGFLQQLENWFIEHGRGLVVIDTFQMVRGIPKRTGNAYQMDYDATSALKRLADKYHGAIVCVHHTNKIRKVDDPFDKVSGSSGLMGSADTTILIDRDRDSDTATVIPTGRDIWMEPFLMRFTDGKWVVEVENVWAYNKRKAYEENPRVQVIRKLIAEKPNGGRWTYTELNEIGVDMFGYEPIESAKAFNSELKNGLADELLKRDGLLVVAGVSVTKGGKTNKGIKIEPRRTQTEFQTELPVEGN